MTDLYILVCSFLYCHFSNNNKITISIAIIKYFSSVSHCISYKKTVTHHCFGTKMMPWFSGTNSQFCQISRSLFCCCSVAQSCLTLRPHGAQHPRIPCASLSHWVCSNSHPLSWWHYPTISSSVTPCSFCPQSFPASGSFPMSQLFALGGLSIGASASVLPMSIQGLFPLGLTDLTSFCPRGSWESSPAPQFKSINSSVLCLLNCAALIFVHEYQKDHSLDYMDLCQQVS